MKYLSLDTAHAGVEPTDQQRATVAAAVENAELPAFHQHSPDIAALKKLLEPYQKFSNIIIIANGGSRTSALAYWQSLAHLRNEKTVEFLATMEPDVITGLKQHYSPEDTVVMPISKSGTNVDVLEPLMQFVEDYTILPVTSPEKGVLYDIARVYEWDIIPHPEVGGRYSGRTECGLAPALLMGLDIDAINAGAVAAYDSIGYGADLTHNIAFEAAAVCAQQEEAGITEIFMPIYSVPVSGFLPLMVQLLHESTGKDGKGQTIFGDQAPESQHHTNQRYFGGRKDVMGWFVTVEEQRSPLTTVIPEKIANLGLREGTLHDLADIPLTDALRFDYEGVAENSTNRGIPHMTLQISEITPGSMGELLSFLHYYTVYSALLRDQDPFDQPEVEAAKDVSFAKRLDYSA